MVVAGVSVGVREMGKVGKRLQIIRDKTKSEDLMYNLVIIVDNTVLSNWNLLREENLSVLPRHKMSLCEVMG